MLGHVDQVELLTALHAGVYETPPWQTFIERLRRRVRADRCWLMIGSDDPDRPNHDWLAAAPGLAGCEAAKSVPAMIRSARQRPGRLYAGVDLMALLPDPSLWPDLFDRHWRTVRVTGAGELSGWIAVTRSSVDFSAADGATLTALVPHLAVALQTKEVLEDQRRRATLGEMLLDRVGLGWAWVGTDGEIGAASPVARNILANGGRHLQPDGADAIRLLLDSQGATAGPDADRCIAVRSTTPDIGLRKVRAPPVEPPAPNAMLLIVRAPPPEHGAQIELLTQQFKLTPTEAKLALLLARNLSIAEAAAALDLTVDTARNYSKRLYFKTATRGLSELVRRVLLSVAILG